MITEHRHKNKRAADRLFAGRARDFEVFARAKRTRILSYKYQLNKDKLENYFAIFSENRKTTHLCTDARKREMLFFPTVLLVFETGGARDIKEGGIIRALTIWL